MRTVLRRPFGLALPVFLAFIGGVAPQNDFTSPLLSLRGVSERGESPIADFQPLLSPAEEGSAEHDRIHQSDEGPKGLYDSFLPEDGAFFADGGGEGSRRLGEPRDLTEGGVQIHVNDAKGLRATLSFLAGSVQPEASEEGHPTTQSALPLAALADTTIPEILIRRSQVSIDEPFVIPADVRVKISAEVDDAPDGAVITVTGGSNAFVVSPGALLSLSDITITGGQAERGGAISVDHATVALTNCTLFNNTAFDAGGAIYARSSSLSLNNVTIQANYAGTNGGGILLDHGAAAFSMDRVDFRDNFALDGVDIMMSELGALLQESPAVEIALIRSGTMIWKHLLFGALGFCLALALGVVSSLTSLQKRLQASSSVIPQYMALPTMDVENPLSTATAPELVAGSPNLATTTEAPPPPPPALPAAAQRRPRPSLSARVAKFLTCASDDRSSELMMLISREKARAMLSKQQNRRSACDPQRLSCGSDQHDHGGTEEEEALEDEDEETKESSSKKHDATPSSMNHRGELINLRDIDLSGLVAQSVHSQVYSGTWRRRSSNSRGTCAVATGSSSCEEAEIPECVQVAVKRVHITPDTNLLRVVKRWRSEVAILRSLAHNNVVAIQGIVCETVRFKTREKLAPFGLGIVFDWMPVSLRDKLADGSLLRQAPHGSSPLNRIQMHIISDVASGLAYLHRKGIVHRDLKSSNIMLDSMGNAKISDLGAARLLESRPLARTQRSRSLGGPGVVEEEDGEAEVDGGVDVEARPRGVCASSEFGTLLYAAPEMLEGKALTEKVDVFSLAVVFVEVLRSESAFQLWRAETGRQVLTVEDCRGWRPQIADFSSSSFGTMVRWSLGEASDRPSSSEIVDGLRDMAHHDTFRARSADVTFTHTSRERGGPVTTQPLSLIGDDPPYVDGRSLFPDAAKDDGALLLRKDSDDVDMQGSATSPSTLPRLLWAASSSSSRDLDEPLSAMAVGSSTTVATAATPTPDEQVAAFQAAWGTWFT